MTHRVDGQTFLRVLLLLSVIGAVALGGVIGWWLYELLAWIVGRFV
jgi:uncharacterized membrane protein YuzA (DUF378 family)